MVNTKVFGSATRSPSADSINQAGGAAYSLTARTKLANIAATNCFNGTYYASSDGNLKVAKEAVKELMNSKDAEFIAKTAVYSAEKAHMKDMPAFLLASLVANGHHELFHKVFGRTITSGKMLRNFVQIGRSGEAGRVLNMSSSAIRAEVSGWFQAQAPHYLLNASVGNSPTLRDIIKMSRPRLKTKERKALVGYLMTGKTEHSYTRNKEAVDGYSFGDLPEIVCEYERFKSSTDPGRSEEIPNVDFRLLDSILSPSELESMWMQKAVDSSWTFTRMNLNNFLKYGVFNHKDLVDRVSEKLKDRSAIAKAKAYPYQLFMTYMAIQSEMPAKIKNSLGLAVEIALENVPFFAGNTVVAVDVSGSMHSPVTGHRRGASTNMRCVDVAGLFASAVLRRNPETIVLPFDTSAYSAEINPMDSVFTNAKRLAEYGGGGTNCSLPMSLINHRSLHVDQFIYFSDNESWVDLSSRGGTGVSEEWEKLKRRCKNAKLICVDLTPNTTSQINSRKDVLQIGGFGDQVFDVIGSFLTAGDNTEHWVNEIMSIEL